MYLTKGGMPFLYQFPFDEESGKQYLRDIYESIILKDIVKYMKNENRTLSTETLYNYIE